MSCAHLVNHVVGRISTVSDKRKVLQAKLDDLLQRARRVTYEIKNSKQVTDRMFGIDLQNFRKFAKSFDQEVLDLDGMARRCAHAAVQDEAAQRPAMTVLQQMGILKKDLRELEDQGRQLHLGLSQTDFKIESYYLVQDIEKVVQKADSLPGVAQVILHKVIPTSAG